MEGIGEGEKEKEWRGLGKVRRSGEDEKEWRGLGKVRRSGGDWGR